MPSGDRTRVFQLPKDRPVSGVTLKRCRQLCSAPREFHGETTDGRHVYAVEDRTAARSGKIRGAVHESYHDAMYLVMKKECWAADRCEEHPFHYTGIKLACKIEGR